MPCLQVLILITRRHKTKIILYKHEGYTKIILEVSTRKKYKKRVGSYYKDEDGIVHMIEPEKEKKYKPFDLKLFQKAVSSEPPAQLAERRKRNGEGLQRYTRYL